MIVPINSYSFPSGSPKKPLSYLEFLETVKVVRMLYDKDRARKYFTDNLQIWYNIDNSKS